MMLELAINQKYNPIITAASVILEVWFTCFPKNYFLVIFYVTVSKKTKCSPPIRFIVGIFCCIQLERS